MAQETTPRQGNRAMKITLVHFASLLAGTAFAHEDHGGSTPLGYADSSEWFAPHNDHGSRSSTRVPLTPTAFFEPFFDCNQASSRARGSKHSCNQAPQPPSNDRGLGNVTNENFGPGEKVHPENKTLQTNWPQFTETAIVARSEANSATAS